MAGIVLKNAKYSSITHREDDGAIGGNCSGVCFIKVPASAWGRGRGWRWLGLTRAADWG